MGNAHPWSISLLMDLSSAAEFSSEWDDLWFPLSIIEILVARYWAFAGPEEYGGIGRGDSTVGESGSGMARMFLWGRA